jgi:hypothetical protein
MNFSQNPNPNFKDLVDRYLQAVRFWMPKSARQEDTLAELGEDLRSQIEEKEIELGRSLNPDEVSAILKRCGSPMMVAGRLGPSRHLIGPAVFPIYAFVLKMVLLWIMVPVFLFIIGPVNLANAGGEWGPAIAATLANFWFALFIAAGIITLVFAIVERTSSQLGIECKWDPLKLPPVRLHECKTSSVKSACELFFASFGLVWLLLMPHYPFLILGPAAVFLKAAPLWHVFYIPFLLLSLVALLRPAVTLWRPDWASFPLWSQLLQTILTFVLLNFLINAAHAGNGSWQPFLILQDAVANSAHFIEVAGIVNLSILLCLATTWLGLCIASVVQVWQLLMYLRKRVSGSHQPATLAH